VQIALTAEEIAFGRDIRAVLRAEIPEAIRGKANRGEQYSRDDYVTTQKILNEHGLAVPHWPAEWGGRGWTPLQRHLWSEETALAQLPLLPVNTALAGPVIAAFGNEQLKRRFLPKTASADIWWCQGFSEPNAGSDLASVRTTAVRDGDEYVVNGQKIWTTQAHFADWMFCLVRTDPDVQQQRGLSFILFDLRSPGVTVRPIRLIDGSYEVAEVFLDNVRVPVDQLVGEENRGWDYTKYVLVNERVGSADTGLIKARLLRLKRIAARTRWSETSVLDNPLFRDRLTWLEIETQALEVSVLRALENQTKHPDRPDPVSSLLKLQGSVLQQQVSELLTEVLGAEELPYRESPDVPTGFAALPEGAVDAMPTYFNWRKASIYGGSTEVQRMIMAKSILNL
jgi:alkylation response protein AidB-like acyl-CoA dehydrogenase